MGEEMAAILLIGIAVTPVVFALFIIADIFFAGIERRHLRHLHKQWLREHRSTDTRKNGEEIKGY